MARTDLKIINLQEYKALQRALESGAVDAVLSQQRMILRKQDLDVLELLDGKYKLKDIRTAQLDLLRIERFLVAISDWLQDQVGNDDIRTHQNECNQLFTKSERIKENLAEAAADSRHIETKNEFNVVEIATFLTTLSITAYTIIRMIPGHKTSDVEHAVETGIAAGTALAFHKQIRNAFQKVGEILVELPEQSRSVKISVRNSIVSTALAISVLAKQQTSIEPMYPVRGFNRPEIVAEAKL